MTDAATDRAGGRPGERSPRRFLVPEAVQASPMDCGPTALHALLAGFGRRVSYARLREACQTDVDGTSINALEEVARTLGLDARQLLVPAEHVAHPRTTTLPALAVTRLPGGTLHFVLLWRRLGPWLQVMDPASGRRWVRVESFRRGLHVHSMDLPAAVWRGFAGSRAARAVLVEALRELGHGRAEELVDGALADPHWLPIAALEAAVAMVRSLVAAEAVPRGRAAAGLVSELFERARGIPRAEAAEPAAGAHPRVAIPAVYWSVRASSSPRGPSEPELLTVRGALLVRALRLTDLAAQEAAQEAGPPAAAPGARAARDLRAAVAEPALRIGRVLWAHLQGGDRGHLLGLTLAVGVAALAVLAQALVFRALFELGAHLSLDTQRFGAALALLVLLAALFALELPLADGFLRLGRHLEARLRTTFQTRLPHLPQRWFESRPSSDLAERAHALFSLREFPPLYGRAARAVATLGLTAIGLVWLDPGSALLASLLVAASCLVPLVFRRTLAERELLVRGHHAALSRFYLEALLGLVAVRVHGAERALRREHESLLVEWSRAGLKLARGSAGLRGSTSLATTGLAIALVIDHLTRLGTTPASLLFAYWALALPVLGEQLAQSLLQAQPLRNAARRALEPLGAAAPSGAGDDRAREPEHADLRLVPLEPRAERSELWPVELKAAGAAAAPLPGEAAACQAAACEAANLGEAATHPARAPRGPAGLALELRGVAFARSGQRVLAGLDLALAPGEHTALVGRSGAGKSSFLALLLGLHEPSAGRILADGCELTGAVLAEVRRSTAWVDPAVQLWNKSAFENLVYGVGSTSEEELARALSDADLAALGAALPDGLATRLGEGGTFLSGGEGQRMRLGRALLRPGVRLALLDEPFRGVDRATRSALLERARARWRHATLVCVTHDLGQTQSFDRVVVLEHGEIVEQGMPADLARDPSSVYARLLAAERQLLERGWHAGDWTHWHVEEGRLTVTESRRRGGPA